MTRHAFLASLDDDGAPRRLDQAIAAAVPGLSRRRARELITRGSVWVDGARVRTQGRLLPPGARVEVNDDAGIVDAAVPPILVDRRTVVVVDKPAGVACEPTRQATASVTDAFARAGRPLRAVHRLDVDTSGVLLLATGDALARWSAAFREGRVARGYVAVVAGVLADDEGVVDAPLLPPGAEGRARVSAAGKPSVTAWRVLARAAPPHGEASLLLVTPRTGRTHQIRAHLAHIGHPLVGDHRYARKEAPATHLGLHALDLSAAVDADTALSVRAPLPEAFLATARAFGLAIPALPTPQAP